MSMELVTARNNEGGLEVFMTIDHHIGLLDEELFLLAKLPIAAMHWKKKERNRQEPVQ